jgi:hypothetical protein
MSVFQPRPDRERADHERIGQHHDHLVQVPVGGDPRDAMVTPARTRAHPHLAVQPPRVRPGSGTRHQDVGAPRKSRSGTDNPRRAGPMDTGGCPCLNTRPTPPRIKAIPGSLPKPGSLSAMAAKAAPPASRRYRSGRRPSDVGRVRYVALVAEGDHEVAYLQSPSCSARRKRRRGGRWPGLVPCWPGTRSAARPGPARYRRPRPGPAPRRSRRRRRPGITSGCHLPRCFGRSKD